jgi:hypothetical protein
MDFANAFVSISSNRRMAFSIPPALLASATISSDFGVSGVAKRSG